MSDKKHIDRLFQESFKDFEVTPNDAVWKNIEAQLNQKKKKRRVIPIWWRYAGVAALLLLSLTIGGIYFNNTDTPPNNQIVDIEDATAPTDLKDNIVIDNSNNTKNAVANSKNDDIIDTNTSQNKTEHTTPYEIVSSQKSSPIAETSASENSNNENNGATNIATQKKQNTLDKLINTKRNNNAVAEHIEEKNSADKTLNKSKNNIVVASNSEENKDVQELQNTIKNSTAVTSDSEKNNQVPQHNKTPLIDKNRAKEVINNASKNNHVIAKTENTETVKNDTSKEEKNSLTIEEAIDKNKDIIAEEKENKNRWSIAPNAAPVYFNTLGKGSSLGQQLNNNSKSGDVNMSYGISASYALNEKVSIRSGINRVNLGYDTNNVVAYQSVGVNSSRRELQNVTPINTNTSSSPLENDGFSLVDGQGFSPNDVPESFSLSDISTYNQDLGYIEVPLEIQYALLNKKLGVNVIGGFSSFFLNNHKVFSESENGERTLLGKANNINKISYSANFGLGFKYRVSKRIDLNLEPMFKYQINTFNNTTGDFKPFFIGVYSGFAIKF
ncbi:outer membrane beta-barrel protein [Flavivirga eckloniae]|uniref:Uncharacterized protein n=1 Tax=Flavivirga eckloniae TaxID=1803846 RepID=A0A2K9PQH7_9FLAO|nr:outer membrane beta-barrel protein [Flavivirga eckloniae]AUP79330.1 hypothetical protein C1H87_11675 [Flavivirga eckloniae]